MWAYVESELEKRPSDWDRQIIDRVGHLLNRSCTKREQIGITLAACPMSGENGKGQSSVEPLQPSLFAIVDVQDDDQVQSTFNTAVRDRVGAVRHSHSLFGLH
jgi:hypothetical protein